MLSTTLERMALVCDFCAQDIPPRQTYWHCTTCHHTHEFEREGGCDICAACYLSSAHKTAGPLPTTATDLPVCFSGTCGSTQPSFQPRSTMAHSIDLIVTGSSTMLSVQAASHGAGQIRPVNSGKLLVE